MVYEYDLQKSIVNVFTYAGRRLEEQKVPLLKDFRLETLHFKLLKRS